MWQLLDLSDDRRDKKPWLPEDDRDVSNGLVYLDAWRKPACYLHGAMHRVSADRGAVRIYRCSEMRCGLGAQLVIEWKPGMVYDVGVSAALYWPDQHPENREPAEQRWVVFTPWGDLEVITGRPPRDDMPIDREIGWMPFWHPLEES